MKNVQNQYEAFASLACFHFRHLRLPGCAVAHAGSMCLWMGFFYKVQL